MPDEWVDNWADNFKKTVNMMLDDFAQIGSLEYDQVVENIFTDPVLRYCEDSGLDIVNTRACLRLYRSLTANQKARFLSEHGIDSRELTPEHYQLLVGVFKHPNAYDWGLEQFLDKISDGITMRGAVVKKGDVRAAGRFYASTVDGKLSRTWRFMLPYYIDPSNKAPAQ